MTDLPASYPLTSVSDANETMLIQSVIQLFRQEAVRMPEEMMALAAWGRTT